MSDWAAKRFWTDATAVALDAGHTVELDGKRVRTPAKSPLIVPTAPMAQAIADEWAAQDKAIDPLSMPVTRSANAAIDKVATQRDEVIELIAAYGDSDMLCYRATLPEQLIARQAEQWDPFLNWSRDEMGAPLTATGGVMHIAQSPDSIARYAAALNGMTDFELAALHDLVGLSGSLVLGFAVANGHAAASDVWPVSRLDELWQQEQWGLDDEAESMSAKKKAAFLHAERFLLLARA